MSTSVGRRGAWLTFGPRGTRTTVGMPGTGLSYTEQTPNRRGAGVGIVVLLVVLVLIALAVFGGSR